MVNENPYSIIRTEVLDVITETPTIKTLRLKPDVAISFVTGQFIELTVPGVGEAPFTPSSRPSVKEEIQVSIMRVGKVTQKIHELKKGDIVGLRGPFGKGYPQSSEHTRCRMSDKSVRICSGSNRHREYG